MKKILLTLLFLIQTVLCSAELQVNIAGVQGHGGSQNLEAHVHPFDTNTGKHIGLVVLNHPFLAFDPEFHPFLNPVNGANMAVNAGFSGVPAFIYEDGDVSDADSGTTTSTLGFALVDSGQNFNTTVSVGMVVKNTTSGTEFANVNVVTGDTSIGINSDIMVNMEDYTIGAEWPGTAIVGGWNFTTDISIVGANDNDEAQFDNPHTTDMSNYVAISGKITLTTWNDTINELLLSFGLADTLVGNSVDLNDFIDTNLLGTQQNFVIPKADLGLSTQLIDDMNLVITRAGGAKPTVDLDDIQLEKAGGSIVYKVTTPKGTRFHITEIRLALADNITGITTVAGATETATVPNLGYDDFMGITSPLTNGIVFTRVENSKTSFSFNIRQLGDFLTTGSNLINHISDGTNTFITLLVEFPEPIVLIGSKGDFLSFTINDDLSGLLQFTAAARGGIER